MDSAAGVIAAIRRHGGLAKLPDAPSGPFVESFDARLLADAIDQELARCAQLGWTKITMHMDVADAMRLASFLRRH